MVTITPIAHVEGGRGAADDDHWGESLVVIRLDSSRFTPEALAGLGDFSHVEIVFHFHKMNEDDITTGARHPRGRRDWPKVGIFAQRGKNRPNRIGACVCRLVHIEGLALTVQGLDAIDGTPVLDIKPVLSGFLPRGEVREPAWAREIMKDYW